LHEDSALVGLARRSGSIRPEAEPAEPSPPPAQAQAAAAPSGTGQVLPWVIAIIAAGAAVAGWIM
jgi:hypothetical protein